MTSIFDMKALMKVTELSAERNEVTLVGSEEKIKITGKWAIRMMLDTKINDKVILTMEKTVLKKL